MGEYMPKPQKVAICFVGGNENLVKLDDIFNLATKCFSGMLYVNTLINALSGECNTVAAFRQDTNELVGYLATSLNKDGILDVGWLLVHPGFLTGDEDGLGSELIVQLTTHVQKAKGIRSKFEIMNYASVYRNAGMVYNRLTKSWEMMELLST